MSACNRATAGTSGTTAAGALERAIAFYATLGVKVERLNRTLATEWAYARAWTSNTARAAALPTWLDHYNLDRRHLGIGGRTPIDRINNGRGQTT